MQTLIHILTAIAFAVHAVVGCCLHHEHVRTETTSVQSHCCHHHNHDHAPSEQPAEDSQHGGPCDESLCTFQVEPLSRASEALLNLDCAPVMSDSATSLLNGVNGACLRVPLFVTATAHPDAQSLRAVLQSWIV